MSLRLTLCPRAIEDRAAAPADSLPLAGGPRHFAACEAVLRGGGRTRGRAVVPLAELDAWLARFGMETAAEAEVLLARLSAPRPPFAGLEIGAPRGEPRIMGIINVTPDSFSDGGDRFDAGRAVADGLAMVEAGAAILDVGGESTRPGSAPVDEAEELRRVLPVVRGLAEAGATVSIDSRRAPVMAAAHDAGARAINDVTALEGDPDSLMLAAERGAPVALMHMQGGPGTMQADPRYDDAALDIYDYLEGRVAACAAVGIARADIAVRSGHRFRQDRDPQPGDSGPDGALSGPGLRGRARGQPQGLHRQAVPGRGAQGADARFPGRRAGRRRARSPDPARPRCRRDSSGAGAVARHF